MADIEKGLPDTKLPAAGELNAVDVDVNAEEIQKGPIEVTSEDDGGATIDFDPNANLKIPGTGVLGNPMSSFENQLIQAGVNLFHDFFIIGSVLCLIGIFPCLLLVKTRTSKDPIK